MERRKVLLVIHGIRTFSEFNTVLQFLVEKHTKYQYEWVNYWPFDVIDLFLPDALHGKTEKRVLDAILRNQRDADLSIIAHSFGTYLVTKLLIAHPTIELEHLILCGAIVPTDYPWTSVRKRISGMVLNDCGTRDVYPPLAELLSIKYGATGVRGVGTPVRDRYFDCGHSGFLNERFFRRWWIPIFREKRLPALCLQGLPKRAYPWYIALLLRLASYRKKVAIGTAIAGAVSLFLLFLGIPCVGFCEVEIVNFHRQSSYENSRCLSNNTRLYSHSVRDELSFNSFIKAYRARWFYTESLTPIQQARPEDENRKVREPIVTDEGTFGGRITGLDRGPANPEKPYMEYPIGVSWGRKARVHWNYQDENDVPDSVQIRTRYAIRRFEIEVTTPEGTKLKECAECKWFGDGIRVVDANEKPTIERSDIAKACSVSTPNPSRAVAACELYVPAEQRIDFVFQILDWNCK